MYINQKDPTTLSKAQSTGHNHIYHFYNKLFAHSDCNEDHASLLDIMEDIDLKKSDQDNTKLEQAFIRNKIASFIKTMSNDRAPGITGITPAFYKIFWTTHCTAECHSQILQSTWEAGCTTVYREPGYTQHDQNLLFCMIQTLPKQKLNYLEAIFAQH